MARPAGPLPPHGTRQRYDRGCKCDPCRAANTAYWWAWAASRGRHRKKPQDIMVTVNANMIRHVLLAQGLCISPTSGLLFAEDSSLGKWLAKGRMPYMKLDALAVYLGTHPAVFMPEWVALTEVWAAQEVPDLEEAVA